jgi:hypothetical protein
MINFKKNYRLAFRFVRRVVRVSVQTVPEIRFNYCYFISYLGVARAGELTWKEKFGFMGSQY